MTTGVKGRNFVLKIGDGQNTQTFTTIGPVRVNRLTRNNSPVDITNQSSAGWQEMLADAGTKSVSISVEGVVANDAAFKDLMDDAHADPQIPRDFQLVSGNGAETYEGTFVIASVNREGSHDGAQTFGTELQSSGAVEYTPAGA